MRRRIGLSGKALAVPPASADAQTCDEERSDGSHDARHRASTHGFALQRSLSTIIVNRARFCYCSSSWKRAREQGDRSGDDKIRRSPIVRPDSRRQHRAGRIRGWHRLGDDEPAREAQRDEPHARRRDAAGDERARDRSALQGAGAHRRRQRILCRHGPEGILPPDRPDVAAGARTDRPHQCAVAMAPAHVLSEADDRDGQRLVLRRRLHAARLLRSRDCGRGGDIRTVRDQLGHHSGRRRDQGGGAGDEPARRALLHHDRRDLRRPQGRGHEPRQRGGAAQGLAQAHEGARRGR